jgi:iron complex outermembrane receptor protein
MFDTDAEFTTDFTRLFTNMEWRLHPDWVLNAGGMVEHSSLSGDHVSPRVMLNWHVIEGQTLRYGVSQAYRPPSTFEKFGNIRYYNPSSGSLLGATTVARGGVEAEGVLSREIGYLGEFPGLGLSLDVRGFLEEVRNFIKTQTYPLSYGLRCSNTCATDYVNGENFNIHGIEYQIKWQPWRGAQVLFSESHVDSGWTDNGTFNARPFSSSSLMFVQQLPAGLDFSLMYYQSDSTNFPGTSSPLAPAMSRTDLRLAKQFRAGTKRGEISFVVQNLGPANQDFLPDFYFRRQAYVMLRLDN